MTFWQMLWLMVLAAVLTWITVAIAGACASWVVDEYLKKRYPTWEERKFE